MKEQAGKQYQQQYIIQIKLFLFHCCDLTWLPTVTHFETFFSHSCYCGVISNSQQHLLFFFPIILVDKSLNHVREFSMSCLVGPENGMLWAHCKGNIAGGCRWTSFLSIIWMYVESARKMNGMRGSSKS